MIKTNKQNRTRGAETRNRLTVTREESEEWKRREGTSQGTCMNDPWTWTTGCGLTVGVGGWAGRISTGEKLGQL